MWQKADKNDFMFKSINLSVIQIKKKLSTKRDFLPNIDEYLS